LLKLRRGTVVSVDPGPRVTSLRVKVESGGERQALAYPGLTGGVEVGDDVVVNVEAQDLGLGSGGFDIVCVNLTRGLVGEAESGAHVMKLNYTPLQHAVRCLEEEVPDEISTTGPPTVVLALHAQLAPAAFAACERAPEAKIGYVQTAGGALPGQLSDVVADLLERGTVSDHVTVAPCFGAADEAITVEGALHAATEGLNWDAALIGPGPGILGSASILGHGGMEALHSVNSARSLGCSVIVAPRVSSGDPRERHRGVSHHTAAVLGRLTEPVEVAFASGASPEIRRQLEHAGPHVVVDLPVDDLLDRYRDSGLPSHTMGRSVDDDEIFFTSALAAGALLASRIEERR
jgi:uncharacterized protein DUF3866